MPPAHLRKHLAALSLGAATLLALPAAAQTTSPAPAATKPADEKKVVVEEKKADPNDPVELEKVQVTGSRIRTLVGEQTALPVFTLDQVQLEQRGVTRLADLRMAIPQMAASIGFNDNLQNSGTSRAQTVSTSFNLRGLGGNSTLVLVDGRRVPRGGQEAPGGAGGREDFNVDGIPVSAIERVEVLPQSAGAIYGAEGIAGVINIVLKKNYTGAEVNLTYDNTFDTDVGQTTVSVTGGYRRGKLSTFFTASYEHQNGLASRDRWFAAKSAFPEFGGSTTFLASQPASGPGSLSSTSQPQNAGQPNLPGQTTNIVGIPAGSNGTTAANSAFTTTVSAPFDPATYSMLIDPANRRSVVFKADYELASWLKPYVETRWSRFDNFTYGTPPTLTFTSLPIGYAGNPFAGPVIIRKVFYDRPVLQTDSQQENLGLALGTRGELFRDWRYDVGIAYARNIVRDNPVSVGFNTTLLNAAINNANPSLRPILAYDSSVVRDPNPAGMLDAFRPLLPHRDTSEVYNYTFQADGTVWENWAGAAKLALGGEMQEEYVKFFRTPGDSALAFVLTKPFSRRTIASFAEVNLPLLSDRQKIPFVHRLEVGGAIRAEDYSDIGSASSPGYHALFQPVKWITLRASHAEGFKSPKLQDLLAPAFTGTANLTVASNVRDTFRGGELVLGTINTVTGGNPALSPETSTSDNWGVVVDVPGRWFKGLSFSADHYELNYTDRIGGPPRQVLIDFFPERVTRAAPSASDPAGYLGLITGLNTSNINLSGVRTRGWDYQVTYQRGTDHGHFNAAFAYSEPGKTITRATPVSNPSASAQPKRFSGSVFWSRGSWGAGVVVNHQARYFISGLTNLNLSYPAYIEWNPQVSYNFGKNASFNDKSGPWWNHVFADSKVTLTVINALDADPSPTSVANGRVVMDARLRRYILSFAKKF